jgi:dihydroneopterin aldolase
MRTRHVGEVADQEFDDVVDLLLAQIVDQRTAQLVHRVAQRLLDQLIALYSSRSSQAALKKPNIKPEKIK